MPTDKEISDLETVIAQKMAINRKERSTLQQAYDGISSIKMMSREEEVTPAIEPVAAKPAVLGEDGVTVITPEVPAVRGKPAEMKTVFDVMPKDPMIPSKKMKEPRRQEIFDACNAIINPV